MGGGGVLRFDLRDSSHCALVLYAEQGGYEELAYCDLWNTYALPSELLSTSRPLMLKFGWSCTLG